MTHRSYLSATSMTASTLNGLPSVCAIMMALVLLVMASSSLRVSMFKVLLTSKNTGMAPNCTMGAIVVGNPQATLITSSPFWIDRLPRVGDVRAEKARIKAEREALESERAKGSASQSGSETQKTGNRRFSSEDYRDAAKSYREEGRDDLAKLAEEKATQIETEDKQEFERKTQEELKSAWDKNLLREVEENPDLKDSNSKLYKAVSEMLQNHAILRNYPAGINDAVGIAKVKLKAEAASDLEKRVAEYERELAQLRKATTPAKGQPSSPAKKKEFHQLSLDEQEQELLRMAAEADRG